MNSLKAVFLSISLLFFPLFSVALAETAAPSPREALEKNLPDFVRVGENVYRGSQPDEENLKRLKELGVRTLVNFRHEKKWIEWEQAKAAEFGFEYISLPWKIYIHPDKSVMEEFLRTVQEKEKGPVFFHCKRGIERTGVADAVYQYYFHKLSEEEAFRKAMTGHNRLFYYRPFLKPRFRRFLRELGPQDSFPRQD